MLASSLKLWVDRFSDRKAGHLDLPATQILSRNTTRGIIMKKCQASDCHKLLPRGGKYCSKHYYRLRKRGTLDRQVGRPQRNYLELHSEKMPNGCIEWRRSFIKSGYGMVYNGKRTILVHRYVWEQKHGKIPLTCLSAINAITPRALT